MYHNVLSLVLFFLIYINDLEDGIKSNVQLFADATSLVSSVQDPENSFEMLQHDFDSYRMWSSMKNEF